MKFVDSHAHLAMLKDDTSDAFVARAKKAGVVQMITVSTEPGDWDPNRDFATKFENVYFSIGIHPHEATRWGEVEKRVDGYTGDKKLVGVGETGLDFYYEHSDRKSQIECFEKQIELAKKLDLPLIIHCRNAFPELYATIKRVGLSKRTGVLHCFTGTESEAKEGLDHGLKISFSGIYTFKNAEDLRSTSKKLPLTEILLETDCPYLAPPPHRGRQNEPSFLPHTAIVLAQTLGIDLAAVAEKTTSNTRQFFRLPEVQ